ncbi:MAG: hypothetical protein PVI90_08070 [Desulfobacteraceae bacterium]
MEDKQPEKATEKDYRCGSKAEMRTDDKSFAESCILFEGMGP